jgi:hypothetical protein
VKESSHNVAKGLNVLLAINKLEGIPSYLYLS